MQWVWEWDPSQDLTLSQDSSALLFPYISSHLQIKAEEKVLWFLRHSCWENATVLEQCGKQKLLCSPCLFLGFSSTVPSICLTTSLMILSWWLSQSCQLWGRGAQFLSHGLEDYSPSGWSSESAETKDKLVPRSSGWTDPFFLLLLAYGDQLVIVDEWIQLNAFNELSQLGTAVNSYMKGGPTWTQHSPLSWLWWLRSSSFKDHTREGLPVLPCIYFFE